MPSAVPDDQVTVQLSLPEALTVLAALRQYMPYWCSAADATAAEQLEIARSHVDSVLAKLRAAAAPV